MPPSQALLLTAWERGLGRDWIGRGLVLLGLACPEKTAPDLETLPIGLRDHTLLGLRETVFGGRMSGIVVCEHCGERLEFDCAVSDLRTPLPAAANGACRIADFDVCLRPPNSADLRSALGAGPGGERALVASCITAASRGGEPVAASLLPDAVLGAIGQRLASLDPQADMRIAFVCPGCAAGWKAPFDIVSFLWNELEAFAQRLLDDVHELALAYGWAERAILDLPAARRQSYLNRARA
jgi:hypothetical protein